MQQQYHFPYQPNNYRPNQWDAVIFILVFALFALLANAASKMAVPYEIGQTLPITLDPSALPGYALRTVIRMLIAMSLSLIVAMGFATWAAKSSRAERLIIPLVDILQSVPVLGFLSITIVGFIMLFPNSLLGPECAAIFAIFTSQVWNMLLSLYHSLKTVPTDLQEASTMYRLSAWQRYWRLEMPYALSPLLWNSMMSMSAGWFFVVAAESISVSNQEILLPGIGSYISIAIDQADKQAVIYAILTMFIVILIYDQILFRPLLRWSEKFRVDESSSDQRATSWVYSLFHRSQFFQWVGSRISLAVDACINVRWFLHKPVLVAPKRPSATRIRLFDSLWNLFLLLLIVGSLYFLGKFVLQTITLKEVAHVFFLGSVTALRIIILIILASLVWVPIGVWIGMRPKARQIVQPIAQFLAAFPANLLFPLFVLMIVKYSLNVNVWTTPLMIIGTQWYILFNVIAGAGSIPKDLTHVAANFGLKGWLWWKRLILPAIFPCYVTGALTAAGGAWNASIVAEVVTWGDTTLIATGLGAYITQYTTTGDFPRIFLGIGVMCVYVIAFNELFWQRLYAYSRTRFRLH
jgi:NitT/TauT family transport system permease protein